MKFLNLLLAAGSFAALITAPVSAADLTGTQVVVSNTFEGLSMSGHTVPETDVAHFGMANNLFATISDTVELPAFLTLYDVDINANHISFNWIESPFSMKVVGPSPDGNHDRNYFTFDLPEGVEISGIVFDADASTLLPDSPNPTAQVVGPNKVVTDFSTGVVRGLGFNPVFTLELSQM